MAWYTDIHQYANWNYSGDSLETEYLLGMQGVGDDAGKTLFFNSTLSDGEWQSTFPLIKEGAPHFIEFRTDGTLKYGSYLYNGSPVFENLTEVIFKSRIGAWLYSIHHEEPFFYFTGDSASAIWRAADGDDLRTLREVSCSIWECYESPNDIDLRTPGVRVFVRRADIGTKAVSSYMLEWHKTRGDAYVGDAPSRQMTILSSYLGEYTCNGQDPVYVGNGCWTNEDGSYVECMSDGGEKYFVDLAAFGTRIAICVGRSGPTAPYSIIETYDKSYFNSVSLRNFSVDLYGGAYIEIIAEAAGSQQHGEKTFTWKGFTLGLEQKPADVYVSNQPWYRQIEMVGD